MEWGGRISETVSITLNIENNIKNCFNKIEGWAFWKNKDSKNSKIYLRFKFKRNSRLREIVVPLNAIERPDVAKAFENEAYRYSGFYSYMPARVIKNKEYIETAELIICNSDMWGSTIILENND